MGIQDFVVTIIEYAADLIVRLTTLFVMIKDFFVNLPSFFSWVPSDIFGLFFLLLSTAVLLRLFKFL